MTYTITDANGTLIGGRVYTEAKYAIAVAKRSAKARSKNAKTLSDGIIYVMENDSSIYGRRYATVTSSDVVVRAA